MINKLIQIIGDEAALFEEFLGLLDRQKEALVANDTARLEEVTELQHRKLAESRALTRRREQTIAAIQAANAIEGDLTVSRLLEYADADQSQRLAQLQQTIIGLNDNIIQARNTNALLLNRSREYISRTIAMLARLSGSEKTYGRDGAAPQGGTTLVVDRRA
jgi:hypothetical protein